MNTTQSAMKSPDEPVPDAASSDQDGAQWSLLARATFIFTGVVLPTIGVMMLYADLFRIEPRFRHAELADCAILLLIGKPPVVFCPFLLYSMTCMALLVFAPGRFAKDFLVRFGVYTGVVLFLHYSFLYAAAWDQRVKGVDLITRLIGYVVSYVFLLVLVVLIPWGIVRLARRFLPRNFRRGCAWCVAGWFLVSVAATLILLIAHAMHPLDDSLLNLCLGVLFVSPLTAMLFCAAPWALASYGAMAVYAARHSGARRLRFSLAQLLGAVTWLAAYLGAWRISVLWMLEAYGRLPASPPPPTSWGVDRILP